MRYELRRIEPLRAANIIALVYGIMMTVFAVIFSPFLLLMTMLIPAGEQGAPPRFLPIIMLVFYPVIGLIMGWISGLIGSATYNLVVRWTGGLQFEMNPRQAIEMETPIV